MARPLPPPDTAGVQRHRFHSGACGDSATTSVTSESIVYGSLQMSRPIYTQPNAVELDKYDASPASITVDLNDSSELLASGCIHRI